MIKADLFKADKTMSSRVVKYTTCKILARKIRLEFSSKIAGIQSAISSQKDIINGVLATDDSHKSTAQTILESLEAQVATLTADMNKQISEEASFEYSEADKAFRKAVKGLSTRDTEHINKAICEWFKTYNLDVADTTLLRDIAEAIGGKEDWNKFVDTGAYDMVSVDPTRALTMLYWVAYHHMVVAGTIKPAQLPSVIANKFGKVAADKRKAAKKAEKENA